MSNGSGKHKNLRKGYTTGACASAGAVAAYLALTKNIESNSVKLDLPGGKKLRIPVDSVIGTTAVVIKDAGDDPDVTNKVKIGVKVEKATEIDIDKEDYVENCANGFVIIKGGEGVGMVTRPGLDAEVGKWAINPGPRKMILHNLAVIGFGRNKEYISVEISAVNGEYIAKRTLNPTLGIKGGISILGNSGIVEPYSNSAYIHTIKIHIRCAAEDGEEVIALTTGSRTQNAIRRECPALTEKTCIRIGDFIADSLKAASETDLKTVNVVCMPGKLYKYACGYEYTHAHKVKLKPELLVEELSKLGVGMDMLNKIRLCDTIGEASSMIEGDVYFELLNRLADKAALILNNWAGKVNVNLFVFDSQEDLILKRTAKK